jgi:hypothetical protein
VVYIRGSTNRIVQFIKLTGRLVPIDNRIKWNSWYKILDILLFLRPYIKAYYQAYKEELKDDILSFKE